MDPSTPPESGGQTPEPLGVEIALLDTFGVIVAVNEAWQDFAVRNGADLSLTGVGMSYLQACDAAAGDESARQVRIAVELAIAGELSAPVTMQIPCDSPSEPRWFDVLVSSRFDDDRRCIGATVTLSRTTASRRPDDAGAAITFPDQPRQEMERLVAELADRVRGVLNAQSRWRLLIEATSTLAAEPKLSIVLTQLTVLARELVGATHATVHRIGAGALTPGPHQLAVPIRVRGDLFGTLCLTGSPQGTFDAEDVWLTNTLATIAGVAIDNAFLLADVERRQRWQSALADAGRALRAGATDDRLAIIAKFAAIAADAEAGHIVTTDGDAISLAWADGVAVPARIASLNCDTAASVLRTNRPALRPDHRTMWAPLGDSRLGDSSRPDVSYALGVARATDDERFERADLDQLAAFAQLVFIATEDRDTGR